MGTSDGSQPGGVGTMTRRRPAAHLASDLAAHAAAAHPTADPAAEPGVRPGGPARPQAPPRRAGRRRPVHQAAGAGRLLAPEAAPPSTAADAAPLAAPRSMPRHTQRMPFFLLLCCLLGGALICALVISTTLAAGSFQITRLQQADNTLARQRQALEDQVARAQSAAVIEQRAAELGMRQISQLRFLDLKTGTIESNVGTGAVRDIHVPGYTP